MPKQSPAWNKYSNYYFLSAEIAAGINALAMTFVLSHEIGLLALLARNDIIWKFWLRLYVLKPLRVSVWVKGNALIVAEKGFKGERHNRKCLAPLRFSRAF